MINRLLLWWKNTPQRNKLRLIAAIPFHYEDKDCIIFCKANCNGMRCISVKPEEQIEISKDLILDYLLKKWVAGECPHQYIREIERQLKEKYA